MAAAGLPCKISVKLSQIGLELDRSLCTENLRRILVGAQHHGGFVRIDMEGSARVDDTLDVFETVWQERLRNVGVVLQAYLYRTEEDLRRVIAVGARVRLCKGAYSEPSDVAYRDKAYVDAAFVRLMKMLLTHGNYPAFATHDPRMIAAVCRFARERDVRADAYEFQMLYGVRRDLQASLRDTGVLGSDLPTIRPRVVPLLHEAAGGTPGECGLRSCGACSTNAWETGAGSVTTDVSALIPG